MAGFSALAAPLTHLLQKERPWIWTEKQQDAFELIKQKLVSAPVLKYPDFSKCFIVTTDALDLAVSGVLQQQHEGGLHPCAYFSKKLKGLELNWTVREKEIVAKVLALRNLRCFLEGRLFILQTNHHPLVYIFKLNLAAVITQAG